MKKQKFEERHQKGGGRKATRKDRRPAARGTNLENQRKRGENPGLKVHPLKTRIGAAEKGGGRP